MTALSGAGLNQTPPGATDVTKCLTFAQYDAIVAAVRGQLDPWEQLGKAGCFSTCVSWSRAVGLYTSNWLGGFGIPSFFHINKDLLCPL